MGETSVVAVWQEVARQSSRRSDSLGGGARLSEINLERGLKRRFLRAEKNGRSGRPE